MRNAVLLLGEKDDCGTAVANMLRHEGHEVMWSARTGEALVRVIDAPPPLLVVGRVPGQIELCATLRDRGFGGGILMVIEGGEELHRVAALDAGADDCVSEPARVSEVVARARSVLRRVVRSAVATHLPSGARLDPVSRSATRPGGATVALSAHEFTVMYALAAARDHVVSREMLSIQVWGDPLVSSKRLDAVINRLRTKLRNAGFTDQVEVVRAVGFRLVPGEAQSRAPA